MIGRLSLPVVALTLLVAEPTAAPAQNVETVIERFADYWARGDVAELAALSDRDGISLNFEGKPIGPLGERQVAAMLRRLFEQHETLHVRKRSAQIVGREANRAFGEISWMIRSRGTTIPEENSVFVALKLRDGRWRVTEIRLARP